MCTLCIFYFSVYAAMLCVDFIVLVIKYCEIAMQHTFYRIILVLIIYVFFYFTVDCVTAKSQSLLLSLNAILVA